MLPFTPQSLVTLLNLKVDIKDKEIIKKIDKIKFLQFCKKHGFTVYSKPMVKDFNNEDLKTPSKVVEIYTHEADNFKEIWMCEVSDINYARFMFDNFYLLEKLTNIPQLLILLEVISNDEVIENKQEVLAKQE